MKANELMIADWVYYKGKEQMPSRVISIGGNSIRFDNGTLQDWMSDVGNFTPIPLTSEILKSNGFNCEEIIQPHWISEDGRILLRNDESLINSNNKWSVHVDNEDMQTIGYFELTYVHQLQHALRLCGIEKEIEI